MNKFLEWLYAEERKATYKWVREKTELHNLWCCGLVGNAEFDLQQEDAEKNYRNRVIELYNIAAVMGTPQAEIDAFAAFTGIDLPAIVE